MAVDSERMFRFPPSNLDGIEIPRHRQPGRVWFRVHQSRFSALHFSLNTVHRFSHPDSPCALLYLAADIQTCLLEAFGDKIYNQQNIIPLSLWRACCVTAMSVPPAQVCDLTDSDTVCALKMDPKDLSNNDLDAPQSWGLAIQKHPAKFQGIKFKSRFNGRACLVLFERDGIKKRLHEFRLGKLSQNAAALKWLEKECVSLF